MTAESLAAILQKSYFGNTLGSYAASLATFIGSVLILSIAGKLLIGRLKRWASSTPSKLDDGLAEILEQSFTPLLFIGSIHLSFRGLHLHDSIGSLVRILWMGGLTVLGVRLGGAFLAYFLRERIARGRVPQRQAVDALMPVLKTALWGMGIIFFLDNTGVKISAAVAGLGIGGVAVALAAQAVLGDLFSYFAIILDRPFSLGDFIIVDDMMGSVEHVGIKTTRIRSLSGEILVFPNSSLTSSRIRNYQALQERRIVFRFGILYETPLQKLNAVSAALKSIIQAIPETRFDRAHFASFGESSLDFEVVYYVLTGDYNRYMDIQQEINLALVEDLAKRGVSFAYPTRTVYTVPADGSRA